jgi:RNA ligase (TIGR02306 family)
MSSSLIVEVCKIEKINPHNNADSLELSEIKGWQVITRKGQYKEGDKVVFIPPDAILPTELADRLEVRNYLAGSNKDRVKCVRLRGEMSFGLVINVEEDWEVGTNVAEHYGIVKYIPPVRAMAGDAAPEDPFLYKYTDIENMRNFPDIFEQGEIVIATEKIDGSNCSNSISSVIDENGEISYEWKARSHKVKRKRPNDEDIPNNAYWFPYSLDSVKTLIETLHNDSFYDCKNVQIFGEIYGAVRGGHKSLHYGVPGTLNFVAFDIILDGKYVDWATFEHLCSKFKVPTVPVADIFPFSWKKAKEISTGDSIVAKMNGTKHMREGVVIKPLRERTHPKLGRVILKIINDDYLILKNKASDKGEVTDYTDE